MPERIPEPERLTPLREKCDVLVCGGGPAGVAAAIAAARAGATTRLIELGGCLGGIWTAGGMAHIIDPQDKGVVLEEIMATLEKRGAKGGRLDYDPEQVKRLLEEMCAKAGVALRYHTRIAGVQLGQDKRIRAVFTESKSGREAWAAATFIDCTGDGDLAALAGCGFDWGRPEDGATQPMSMIALVGGIHLDEIRELTNATPNVETSRGAHKIALRETMQRAGVSPSYGHPTLFHLADDLFMLMSNHECGFSAINADDVTAATLEARAELHRQIEALRSLGGPWKNMRILSTSNQIGTREGRRIHGLHTVTKEDLIAGTKHPDAVCRIYVGVDIHQVRKDDKDPIEKSGVKTQPYDIPLRALIARDVDNLMMAGRCISGDFHAHASYRMTGTACGLGEAAGRVAARAAQDDCSPRAVGWPLRD